MEKPNMDHIRDLLKAKDLDAVAKIEPQLMDWCDYKIKTNRDEGFSIQSLFLGTINGLEKSKKKNPQDPLPDYCLEFTAKLMDKYHLTRINDYKDIQVGDATYYCWKHKGKNYINPVDVVAVYGNQKVKIRYTHHHDPDNGFEHTFTSQNFKFAIRQTPVVSESLVNVSENPHDYYFFFNS